MQDQTEGQGCVGVDAGAQSLAFRLLAPAEVIARWPELREKLEPAVQRGRGELQVDDLRTLVLRHCMFIFALERDTSLLAAVTAEFVVYPRQTVLVIGFGAGIDCAPHAALIGDTLRDFARKAGAGRIVTYVQDRAMVRFHERFFGGRQAYTVMEFKC